jgi:hypothetical protein
MTRLASLMVMASLVLITLNPSMAQVDNIFPGPPGSMTLGLGPVGQTANPFPPANGSITSAPTATYIPGQASKESTTFGPGCRTYNTFRTPIGSITFGLRTSPPPDIAP